MLFVEPYERFKFHSRILREQVGLLKKERYAHHSYGETVGVSINSCEVAAVNILYGKLYLKEVNAQIGATVNFLEEISLFDESVQVSLPEQENLGWLI